MMVIEHVKPSPIPSPSKRAGTAPCLLAYDSARPKMIQLTTISGIYTPSASLRAGRYACIKRSTSVTNEAMTTINDGILTVSGMTFLSNDITRLERARTKVVARPIDRPLMADVVTASVGHIPSTRTVVGFSTTIPFKNLSSGVSAGSPRAPFLFSLILLTSFQNVCIVQKAGIYTIGNCFGSDSGT